jgi:lipopolysaccharide export system protein LptA
MPRLAVWLLTAALSTGPAAAQQAPADPPEPPLVVESQEMVISEGAGQAVYRGDVVATKGELVLRCERLVVEYAEGSLTRAHAYGDPVTIDRGPRHGEAQEAIYHRDSDSLLLMGQARLKEGANLITGERIRYFLASQRTEVFGAGENGGEEGRAKAVFDPENPPSEGGEEGGDRSEKGDKPKQERDHGGQE